MAAFQFPNPTDAQTVTNPHTGVTYVWKEQPGKWVIENNSHNSNSDASSLNLPYQLTVGERDSVTGEDVSAFQILETITLKDALGNNLGDVAFESAGGIGIAIGTAYDYPVISFQANALQNNTKFNKGRIFAEELRSAVVPRTYNMVNRAGVPTARPGEMSIDQQKSNLVTAISFGETSAEGLAIGNVSVGDTLCITCVSQGRKYFYNITSGITNSGIYGVSFIEAESWHNSGNLQNEAHYLEIFPRATAFTSSPDLDNYYNKSEIDEKLAAGIMPGDVDASNYFTKTEVADAIESARASLQSNINATNDLIVPPGQNNPETYYGDYAPTGSLLNGDLWFDAMNLRLNVYSQGAWINPDRNDGANAEDRLSALEERIAQLESN